MADVVCMGELPIASVPTKTGRGRADADTFQRAAGGPIPALPTRAAVDAFLARGRP